MNQADLTTVSGAVPLRTWMLTFTISIATFMEVLDGTVANVALPYFSGDLAVPIDQGSWALTSYLVATGIAIPIADQLSKMIGRKRYYMSCVAIFTVASILCGMATSLEQLVFFRLMQGLAGGGMRPTEQAILLDTFPVDKRGTAMSILLGTALLAPALGPMIGGYFTEHYSWRWIFYINIPFGLLSLALTHTLIVDPDYLVEERQTNPTTLANFDRLGFLLAAISFGLFQVVLDRGQTDDWFGSQAIVVMSTISLATGIAFVIWELRVSRPLLDLRLLKDRTFAVSTLLVFAGLFVYSASQFLLSLFVQLILHYNPTTAGEVVGTAALFVVLLVPVLGWLIDRGVDARLVVASMATVGVFGQFLFSQMSLQVTPEWISRVRLLQILGSAGVVVPLSSVAFAFLAREKIGPASTLFNVFRNAGSSIGIAFVTIFLYRRTQVQQHNMVGHFQSTNPHFLDQFEKWRQIAIARGADPYTAETQGMAMGYDILRQQANYFAFAEVFWMVGFILAFCIPLVLLIKRRNKKAG